jgi:hypothetical protein
MGGNFTVRWSDWRSNSRKGCLVFTSLTAAALGLLFENPLKSKFGNSLKSGRKIRGSESVIHSVPARLTLVMRTHMLAEGGGRPKDNLLIKVQVLYSLWISAANNRNKQNKAVLGVAEIAWQEILTQAKFGTLSRQERFDPAPWCLWCLGLKLVLFMRNS